MIDIARLFSKLWLIRFALSMTAASRRGALFLCKFTAPISARLFDAVMQQVQLSRQRNGAYGWSIARDIADPELWTERFHCPTRHDYLRQRNRSTEFERTLHLRAINFHLGPEPIRIRRMKASLVSAENDRPICALSGLKLAFASQSVKIDQRTLASGPESRPRQRPMKIHRWPCRLGRARIALETDTSGDRP